MPKITFSHTPDYNSHPLDLMDTKASVEYSFEIVEGIEPTLADIEFHFYNWLRALGYVIND